MRLVAILFAFAVSLAAVGGATLAEARCAPAHGGSLMLLTDEVSVTRGGAFLLRLEPRYGGGLGESPSLSHLTARPRGCTREGCATRLSLRALAWNLYAAEVPASTPHGELLLDGVRSASAERGRRLSSSPRSAPFAATIRVLPGDRDTATADSLGLAPQVAGLRVTRGSFRQLWIDLTTPSPVGAVGLIVRWRGVSHFSEIDRDEPTTTFPVGTPPCWASAPRLPAIDPGTDVEVIFIDSSARLSPSARFVASEPVDARQRSDQPTAERPQSEP